MSSRRYDAEISPYVSKMPGVADYSTIGLGTSPYRRAVEQINVIRGYIAQTLDGSEPRNYEECTKRNITIPAEECVKATLDSLPPDVPASVKVRVYSPPGEGPFPCVLQIHGGGFMLGSIEMCDSWCQRVSVTVKCVVVSVEYRLAPENPFPSALFDCYHALRWLHSNAKILKADCARLAVMGQSAGACLAASLCILARDEIGAPSVCFQLLDIPVIDDRLNTPSMISCVDTPIWNLPNAKQSWAHYLADGQSSMYAAPGRLSSASGLPDAFISVMEHDPLRDEGIEYALKLLQAGLPVELHLYPGTFHASSLIRSDVSSRIEEDQLHALQRALYPLADSTMSATAAL